jgi:hypothetical protein
MTATGLAPVPDPPQGPGVMPPFPVPPTEGRSSRLWFGLGIGALVLVLACGGGIAAVIGLGTVTTRALNEQAHVVVGGYFSALRQKHFDQAYAQLCPKAKDDETAAQFAGRLGSGPAVTSYDVGSLAVSSIEPVVPVRVTYDTGDTRQVRVYLSQNRTTGAFEVCDVQE